MIRKKYLFYVLAFTSAIITAINSGVDVIVSNFFITDIWALGLAIFVAGIPLTLFLGLFFSIPIKKKSIGSYVLDPSFKRIRFIKKQEIKPQLIAGFGNAINTIGYYILLSLVKDPSVVLPFSQLVIVYIVAVESINEKDMPTLSEIQSIIIVTFGAILGSISLSGSLNPLSLLIVFLVINPGWMLLSISQRKLKLLKINNLPNDSINIRFWNVVFSSGMSAFVLLIIDILSGESSV